MSLNTSRNLSLWDSSSLFNNSQSRNCSFGSPNTSSVSNCDGVCALHLSFRETNGKPISIKHDGVRFTAQKTFKFRTGSIYQITLRTTPPMEFQTLSIANSELSLLPLKDPGEYMTLWDTSHISPTKDLTREYLQVTLHGWENSLEHTLQCKFYPKSNHHADFGPKLDAVMWSCRVERNLNANRWDNSIFVTKEWLL
uniref:CB1 cannabinoid receptor-interacting protein 1 n=1 Tax=Panagrolaimus sp. JU765 TaxID=591449 RepID=A0AC34RC01_9BILA